MKLNGWDQMKLNGGAEQQKRGNGVQSQEAVVLPSHRSPKRINRPP
jgi:hypothetical protein